jgi:hypothetical protein
MITMRGLPIAAVPLLLWSCASTDDEPGIVVPYENEVKEALEQEGNEEGQIIRRTHQNVRRYEELRIEVQTQPMEAMRRTIAQSVDDNFEVFRKAALDRQFQTLQTWAVACLGFAVENRAAARALVESQLGAGNLPPWLLATACFALRVMRDPSTDLSLVIPLMGHADAEVRASAAHAVAEVWAVSKTPRDLTPQHHAAIDRLVGLLHDKATTRGRRAAALALANLCHPAVLEHLISALNDADDGVQIVALRGIERLGDARALDGLFEYLDGSPQDGPASFAVAALQQIAVQNGFAQTKSELESLGTSGKAWRKWFKSQRMGGPPRSGPK